VSALSPSDPSESASQGPYTLDANASQNSSSATAGIAAVNGQPQFLSSTATATTTLNTDGSLDAVAKSVTQPFSIGSLISVGTVQATATMTVNAQGQLTKDSSIDLGSFTIAGLKLGLTQNGFQLLTGVLALPSTSSINSLLAASGLSIKFLPATETATSVTSAGVQISETQTVPVEGKSGVIITLGQATATLQSNGSTTGTGSTTPGTSSETVPASTDTTPSTGGILTPTLSPTLGTTGSGPSASVNPTGASSVGNPSSAAAARINGNLGPDAIRWYLILALAAIALTVASRLAGALAINFRKAPRRATSYR
jgi:hypothetical protein